MTLAENIAWLHRRRLHRRLRSRQHADPLRPAHGADHRRAVGRSGVARSRCGRGVAEKPLDRGQPCGDALARRGKMAARPRRRSCAVQDLLDLRFHRRRQYRPGDGCAARRFRRCHRAGDAGVSGNRPHRLSGQSVRRLGAAERKPAEGPSAQSDARFQSGAGAGAPEQDQDRSRRSRRHRARRGCRPRASCRTRQPGRRRRHHRCGFRSRSRDHRRGGAGSSRLRRRLRHRSRACPGAGGIGAGQIECLECHVRRAGRRTRGMPCRQLFAGDVAADRQRRAGRCRCCISIPTRSSRARTKPGARWPGPRSGLQKVRS